MFLTYSFKSGGSKISKTNTNIHSQIVTHNLKGKIKQYLLKTQNENHV